MNYSRVLHTDDYNLFEGHKEIGKLFSRLDNNYRYEHTHRKWEYGLALDFLKERGAKTVLDVGGGGSIMSPLLAVNGFDVTQIDISNGMEAVAKQNEMLGTFMKFAYADFAETGLNLGRYDAVISISTIEHVPDDILFFSNMLAHSDKLIFLTTDYSVDGKTYSPAHHRTYSKESLNSLAYLAEKAYRFEADPFDFDYRGNFVYEYTFASLALEK